MIQFSIFVYLNNFEILFSGAFNLFQKNVLKVFWTTMKTSMFSYCSEAFEFQNCRNLVKTRKQWYLFLIKMHIVLNLINGSLKI